MAARRTTLAAAHMQATGGKLDLMRGLAAGGLCFLPPGGFFFFARLMLACISAGLVPT
jgi:hypothetical protein